MLELLERGEEGGAFETAGFRNGYDRILTVFLARHTAFELLHAVEIDVVEEILPQMLVEHLRQFGRRTVYHGGKVRNTQVRVGIGFVVFHAVFDFCAKPYIHSGSFSIFHTWPALWLPVLLAFSFLFFLLFSYGSSGGDFRSMACLRIRRFLKRMRLSLRVLAYHAKNTTRKANRVSI